MKTGLKVLILHNPVADDAPADARDVLDQVSHVRAALERLGHQTSTLEVDLQLDRLARTVSTLRPDVVFNLVEAINDDSRLVPLATAMLDDLQVPYTGTPTAGLRLTSDKVLTKRRLRAEGVPTPAWWQPGDPDVSRGRDDPWIVKPLWEDASIGIDDRAIVDGFPGVATRIREKQGGRPGEWFAEQFIEGREINVALLGSPGDPAVLPIPEIVFVDYPAGKPRIVGYAAKWDLGSFECRHTQRHFIDARREPALAAALTSTAVDCWRLCGLSGYARIDCRVDASGQPWVLEVNANPCISPDAGFTSAMAAAGLSYEAGIERILSAACR